MRRVLWILTLILLTSSCAAALPPSTELTPTRSATTVSPPPAETSIDNTISVTLELADSFDVLPGGKCAGRSENAGITDGAPAQLRGDTDGGSAWSTTIVNYQRFPPSNEDDGQYCIVKAVFAPTHPVGSG